MQLYRLVPSRYLSNFGDERRLGIRLRSARGGYESGSYKRFFKMKFYDFLVIISLNLLDLGIFKKTLN